MSDICDEDAFYVVQIQAVASYRLTADGCELMRLFFASHNGYGDPYHLVRELESGDVDYYVKYLRMTPALLQHILPGAN